MKTFEPIFLSSRPLTKGFRSLYTRGISVTLLTSPSRKYWCIQNSPPSRLQFYVKQQVNTKSKTQTTNRQKILERLKKLDLKKNRYRKKRFRHSSALQTSTYFEIFQFKQ